MKTTSKSMLWMIAIAASAVGCASEVLDDSAERVEALDDTSERVAICTVERTVLQDDGTLSEAQTEGAVAAAQACTLYCWTDCLLPTTRAWHSYPAGGPISTGCPAGQICTIDTPQVCSGTGAPGPGHAGEGDSAAGHCVASP